MFTIVVEMYTEFLQKFAQIAWKYYNNISKILLLSQYYNRSIIFFNNNETENSIHRGFRFTECSMNRRKNK